MSETELLQYVRETAEQLVRDLQDAERRTDGWSDAAQTDRFIRAAAQRCLDRLTATGCWGEANRLPSSELWRIARSWLEVGSLQLHARTKPRGYAGDFEMLARICAGDVCDHPLGASFDRFFQSQAAPQAVRNRTDMIAAALARCVREHATRPLRVVSVGSGPAIDVQRALGVLHPPQRQHVHVTLLDLDPAALEYARRQLASLVEEPRLRCVRENLFRLPRRERLATLLQDADFLICSGLFDYLDDESLVAMLSKFWESLRPAGRSLVFNFSPHNPSRAYMEWIGNWYLTYRERDQMLSLAAQAGIPDESVTVSAEATGVNLFWDITKAR
jgi:extracellular factor (EF) 3-hydroxypalmitic acid methyl ester biosynthesis protein